MKNKLTKSTVIGLVVVLIMSLGVVAVFAQDDTPSTETPSTEMAPTESVKPFGHRDFYGGDHHGNDDEALAEALGITVEELAAARQQAAAQRIAQAVEDGYLTEDQANTMLAMQALQATIDKDAITAQVLGLSVEELQAAREDGTLRDYLDTITPADLQARTQEALQAAVQQAVADTIITQDQADLVLEQLENGLGLLGIRGLDGFGGPRGGHGGRGGFHGAPPATEDTETVAPFGNTQNSTAFGA